MVALTTKAIRIDSAEQFVESVSEPNPNVLYVTYGKHTAWINDSLPNTAVDSMQTMDSVWKNMIAGKKITGNDISLVVKRYNWIADTVYTQYDDRANNLYVSSNGFYVLTDDFNVYKCLFNNNGGLSTVKPSYTTVNTVSVESDGYIWKYLYTLNTRDKTRFLNTEYMPVKRLTTDDGSLQWGVQSNAVDGSIDVVLIENAGIGYSNSSNLVINFYGDGRGAAANVTLNTTYQNVETITMTTRGGGYTFANVTISGGGGSGANLRAIMSPFGGHGSDPVYELGASTVMINIKINRDEDGILSPTNDFRQIAIIKDPYIHGTTNAATNTVISQVITLLTGGSGPEFQTDEFVYQGTSNNSATFGGRVFKWDSTTGTLMLTEYFGEPTAANLFGESSGALRFVTDITNPDLAQRSGQVIYIDNIQPVTRSSSQSENITIVIRY